MNDVRIKENSWLARIAAFKLGVNSVALTIGNTIHLYRASREELIENSRWLKHEFAHVEQFRKYGLFTFIAMYVVETIRNGYHQNKYEIQAREAEQDPTSVIEPGLFQLNEK